MREAWHFVGGNVWSGLSVDQSTDTVFLAPGNPGPDMVLAGREGANLYTNSLVALDISGRTPRVKWYYQLVQNDTHDTDLAMIPVLFEGESRGGSGRSWLLATKPATSSFWTGAPARSYNASP